MTKTCKAPGCGNTIHPDKRFDTLYCSRRCLLRMASRRRRQRQAAAQNEEAK